MFLDNGDGEVNEEIFNVNLRSRLCALIGRKSVIQELVKNQVGPTAWGR